MNQEPEIRRNPDGSIDTNYYRDKGLDCRSRAALGLVARFRSQFPILTSLPLAVRRSSPLRKATKSSVMPSGVRVRS